MESDTANIAHTLMTLVSILDYLFFAHLLLTSIAGEVHHTETYT